MVRTLRAEIDAQGWLPGELERWRGRGWRLPFRRGKGELQLVVAAAGPQADAWTLQIAPARVPGPLGRALGRAASATPADCFELARAAHAVLASDERFAHLRWSWDGFADEASPRPEPPVPSAGRRRRGRRGRRGRRARS